MVKIPDDMRQKICVILRQYDVAHAALFGSFARGQAGDESDIDIVVEFRGRRSLLDLAGLKIDLQEALRREVDVVTYNSLHPRIKDTILSEQETLL